jgi:hypothetical protein
MAPGFIPRAYDEVKTWFQTLFFFKCNLYRYKQEEWGSTVSGASEHIAVTEATSRNAGQAGRRITLGMRIESISSMVH